MSERRSLRPNDGATTGLGAAVLRIEDRRLLTGQGRYVDDLSFPDTASAYVLRSPHAHARIRAIDTEAARAARLDPVDALSHE